MIKLLITEFEMQQSGVQKIMDHLDQRLQILRLANDNYRADRSTRGRIAEIKDLQKKLDCNSKSDVVGLNLHNNAMNS